MLKYNLGSPFKRGNHGGRSVGEAGNMASVVRRERGITAAVQLDFLFDASTDIVCVLGHPKPSLTDNENSQGYVIEGHIGKQCVQVGWLH